MKQFCEEVLKFLKSEYNDAYQFEIECHLVVPPQILPNKYRAELTIKMNPGYNLKIVNESMQYLFGYYLSGEFLKDREQYRWQKELIDMIEGG